jgi:hypothetical protein
MAAKCDHLLMDQETPADRVSEPERQLAQQQRIAQLERQLAEAKAAANIDVRGEPPSPAEQEEIDEHARRLAHALQAERERRSTQPEVPQLREALRRAVVAAGLSPEQYREVLQGAGLRSGGKITVGGQVAYLRCDPHDPVALAPSRPLGYAGPGFGYRPGRAAYANRVGLITGLVGGMIGLCVGAAAALTAVFPSSALWMSPIMCPSGYGLTSSTSHYSYEPGQSGTTVSFQCVGGDNAYDVNDFAVFGLQCLLVALVVCVGGALLWRLTRARRSLGAS